MNNRDGERNIPQWAGRLSALYMALAYLAGIIIFVVVLRYPGIRDDREKIRIMGEMGSMVFLTNLLMYVLFGPVLILFLLSLKENLGKETLLVRFSALIGYIWAGSLTASGMVANAALTPLAAIFSSDPDQALYLWRMVDAVTLGLGNGNGEILGGIMTLGFGIAQVKRSRPLRLTGGLGILTGALGIASLIPPLLDLEVVFGLLQLVWFLLSGFTLPQSRRAD